MLNRFFAVSLLIVQSGAYALESIPLKESDKLSYSLGINIGEHFRDQLIEIQPEIFTAGVQDALSNKTPRLNQKEIQNVLAKFQQEQIAKNQDYVNKLSEKNSSEATTFLESNKKQPGVITLASGLQYKIVNEGKGNSPTIDDEVSVHYRGTLVNGTEFDSSYSRGTPASLKLNSVIRGWIEALQLMKPGAKWMLFIPPDLAYGTQGSGRLIGPNSALIFEVELLNVKPKSPKEKEEQEVNEEALEDEEG